MITYIKSDIIDIINKPEEKVICVPTNMQVNRLGLAIMGKGIAKIVADLYPESAYNLGMRYKCGSPPVGYIYYAGDTQTHFLNFPTKYSWRDKSDLNLIENSLKELSELYEVMIPYNVYLPKPGCGLGGLNWSRQVKPLCEKYLTGLMQDFYIFDR